jgi:xanthine dehydrogenase YagS FAD-binding subunit
VAPVPWRCGAAESLLEGHPLDGALDAAAEAALEGAVPLTKNRYKIAMAKGALRRVLRRLAQPS